MVTKSSAKLSRTTFLTSREMDFFSEKELVTQTGHGIREWPLVFVKETIDNALDACEEADVIPEIAVTANETGITVKDNGPGLPESTLKAQLDFSVRASNREAYVAPDRGQQGNGLKTVLPMPRVVDPDAGKFIVVANGKRHVITCGADPISQRAAIYDDVTELGKCKNSKVASNGKSKLYRGTELRIEWVPQSDEDDEVIWPFDDLYPVAEWSDRFAEQFRMLVEGFALFNPHATVKLDWFGEKAVWKRTDPKWEKWKPCKPTSPHWYEQAHLERLIGAYIVHDRETGNDRLVSDFISEFDGLAGSQKRSKVLKESGLHRARLSELVKGDRLDSGRISGLLASMQRHTRPVNPRRLGIIGEEQLRTRLLAMGVESKSFRYSKKFSKCKNSPSSKGDKACCSEEVPWILESAFGYLGKDTNDKRRIYAGANWSAAIKNPFRSFGGTGEGLEAALTEMKVGVGEPVVFVLHLAHPRVEYTDRGKSALIVGGD